VSREAGHFVLAKKRQAAGRCKGVVAETMGLMEDEQRATGRTNQGREVRNYGWLAEAKEGAMDWLILLLVHALQWPL
jgi:hypothetical protein